MPFSRTSPRRPATTSPACGTILRSRSGAATTRSCSSAAGKQWTADKMSEGDYYKLFRDTLGGEVHRLAPQSDYVTGSPDCGDVHFWEVWHGGKPFEVYRDIHGFVSEFGFQSFPEPKTVRTLHRGGRPAVGLFAGHEVPRTLQPHVHGRQGGRPHRHRQDHDPGEEVLPRAERF